MTTSKLSGRPLCEVSRAITALVATEPLIARDLAERLGLDVIEAAQRCSALTKSGHLVIVDRKFAPPARKRVAVYASASVCTAAIPAVFTHWHGGQFASSVPMVPRKG